MVGGVNYVLLTYWTGVVVTAAWLIAFRRKRLPELAAKYGVEPGWRFAVAAIGASSALWFVVFVANLVLPEEEDEVGR